MRDTGWFKSSHSSSGNEVCVEVRLTETASRLRDSKNPEGGHLTIAPAAFAALLRQVSHA